MEAIAPKILFTGERKKKKNEGISFFSAPTAPLHAEEEKEKEISQSSLIGLAYLPTHKVGDYNSSNAFLFLDKFAENVQKE